MELTDMLKKALPWIGAAATGNVPALIAMAAKEVGDVLGAQVAPDAESIAKAVQNASPEQLAELKKAEWDFQARMQEAGYKHAEEMGRQSLQFYTADKADAADARKTFAADDRVFYLAWAVLSCFGACMLVVLGGCYFMLAGGSIKADPSTVAVVAGMIGTIVGYLAANAQQVVSYFFGSSQGSKNSGDAVRQSLSDALKKLGERQVS